MKKQQIKYLELYKREYSVLKKMEKIPKSLLLDLAYLCGLKVDYYNKNKKLLAKGLYIAFGGAIPSNFKEW